MKVRDSIPLKPGYYWAQWRIPADGADPREVTAPSNHWQIVEVWPNTVDWADDPAADEALVVSVLGVSKGQWRDCFVWGDFVCPLDPPTENQKLEKLLHRACDEPLRLQSLPVPLLIHEAIDAGICESAVGEELMRRVDPNWMERYDENGEPKADSGLPSFVPEKLELEQLRGVVEAQERLDIDGCCIEKATDEYTIWYAGELLGEKPTFMAVLHWLRSPEGKAAIAAAKEGR